MPSFSPRALVEAAYVLRFGLVGIANTLLGGGVIAALEWGCGLDPFLANAGGYATGLAVGFFLNRSFTFKANPSAGAPWRYATAVAAAFLGNLAVLALAQAALSPFMGKAIVAQALAMLAYTAISFVLCRLWVFGGSSTRDDGLRPQGVL